MSKRRPERRSTAEPTNPSAIRWPGVLRAIVLGGAVALLVITLLVPSESTIAEGTYAPMAAGWCLLLAVWAISLLIDPRQTIVLGWLEVAGAAFVGWYTLAALVSLGHTNGRQAMNAHWLIVSYGLAVFLLRQTLRTAREARCLVAMMLGLAVLMAGLGLYQYGVYMPRLRREYQADPATVLESNGIRSEAGTPERELFENRLRSVEPLGTFALTNSLAGFLTPWLLASLALAFGLVFDRLGLRWLVVFLLSAAVLAACLVLTKSRTAYLALAAGIVLIGLYGRRGGWRLDWRIPVALAGAGIVIALAAVLVGGLDAKVLSEAPKSVLYRLEYWQATSRIIARYPLFGCGPGNFQEVYAAYKLPQASETLADPHNFLLEVWATAGTPAVILLFGVLVGFGIDMTKSERRLARLMPDDAGIPVAPPQWIICGGAVCGLVLGAAIAAAVGYPLQSLVQQIGILPAIVALAVVVWPLMWWPLASWTERGELPAAAVVIPAAALLLNLLAAGALVFPGVIISLCVLLPAALVAMRESAAPDAPAVETVHATLPALPRPLQPGKAVAGLLVAGSLALAVACLSTEYYPVLNGRLALADVLFRLEQRQDRDAEPRAAAAARADRLSPEPWRLLAELSLARWEATGRPADRQQFVAAANTFRDLDPRHHLAWQTRGNWFLEAWRKSGQPDDLTEAIAAYKKASELFPNRAYYHVQLAWALHLAGDNAAASREASRAMELDARMPHKEQKLARQRVFDPVFMGGEMTKYRPETAEQTASELRNTAAENQP
jgi:tetratricopeptide (TPR) repeat protein